MTDPTPEAPLRDVPCVGCGYDVRGLDPDGRCPECGASIARTLAGNQLSNADPAWLARIVLGQRIASFGLAMTVIGFVVSLFVMFLASLAGGVLEVDWAGTAGEVIRSIILALCVLGGMLLACAGLFLVTSLEPRDTGRELPTSLRMLARYGMVTAIVLLVLGEVLESGQTRATVAIAKSATLLAVVALAIAIPSMLRWLAGLAARIPAPEAVDRATQVAKAVRWQLWTIVILSTLRHASNLVPAGTAVSDALSSVSGMAGCGIALVVILMFFSLLAILGAMSMLATAFEPLAR